MTRRLGVTAAAAALAFGCSGDPAATTAPATAATVAVTSAPAFTARPARKGIDGVLLASPERFHGLAAVPAAAEPRGGDAANAIYDLDGPFADVLAFYQRHHPDAARADLPNGVKLVITPPGAEIVTVRLAKVAFERTRLILTAAPRLAPAASTAPTSGSAAP